MKEIKHQAHLDSMARQGTPARHTLGPWAVHSGFTDKIVPADHASRSCGGSVHEADDRERYALVIASADHNDYSGFAHEIPKQQWRELEWLYQKHGYASTRDVLAKAKGIV